MSAPTLPRFLLFYLFTLFPFYSFTLLLFYFLITLPRAALCLPTRWPCSSRRCVRTEFQDRSAWYTVAHTLANIAIFSVSTNVLPDKPLWLDDPRRPLRASASVVTSIYVGRYEHPRRSTRMGITKVFWGLKPSLRQRISRTKPL